MKDAETYAFLKGNQVFDWNLFLSTDFENVNSQQIFNASIRARNWVTCACGNQCASIPRLKFGDPEDKVLFDLGIKFSEHIFKMSFWHDDGNSNSYLNNQKLAKKVLGEIECRASQLLEDPDAFIKDKRIGI